MGRGAHAAHAAYNGSGTQGISVTDKINENEEIKSVFMTENDTTKQIVHGCNISEMTCSGKIESVNSERYKIFTPDENADMLGDIYLNFEMDSKINEFTFVDESSSNTEYDMYSFTEQSRTLDLKLAGSELKSLVVDLNTNQIPSVIDHRNLDDLGFEVINQTKFVETDKAVYQFIVGKGDSSSNSCNIAWREYGTNNWRKLLFSSLKEVNCVIVEPHAHSGGGIAIFGGVTHSIETMTATAVATITGGSVTGITYTLPFAGAYTSPPIVTISAPEGVGGVTATAVVPVIHQGFFAGGIIVTNGGSGYTSVPTVTIAPPPGYNPLFFLYMNLIKDSSSTITDLSFLTFPDFPLNESGDAYYKTVYTLNYYGERPKTTSDFGNIIVSGSKDHTNETFSRYGPAFTPAEEPQTSIVIRSSYDSDFSSSPTSDFSSSYVKVPFVKTLPFDLSLRLDPIISSTFDDNENNHYMTIGDKFETLLGIDSNKKLIRSYDNGKTWTRAPFYDGESLSSGQPNYYTDIANELGGGTNFKYYIPNLDYVISNAAGEWYAIGKQGVQPTGHAPEDEFRQFIFVSVNEGFEWFPHLLNVFASYPQTTVVPIAANVEYLEPHILVDWGEVEIVMKDVADIVAFKIQTHQPSIFDTSAWAVNLAAYIFPEVTGTFDYEYIGVSNDGKKQIYYGFQNSSSKGLVTCMEHNGKYPQSGKTVHTLTSFFTSIYPKNIKYAKRDLLIGVFSDSSQKRTDSDVSSHRYQFKTSIDGILWNDITIDKVNIISSTRDPLLEGDDNGNFIMGIKNDTNFNLYKYNEATMNFEIIFDNSENITDIYNLNFVSNEWQIPLGIDNVEFMLKSYNLVKWHKYTISVEDVSGSSSKVRKIYYKPRTALQKDIIYKVPGAAASSFEPPIPYNSPDVIGYNIQHTPERSGGVFVYKIGGLGTYQDVQYRDINGYIMDFQFVNQEPNDIVNTGDKVFICCNADSTTFATLRLPPRPSTFSFPLVERVYIENTDKKIFKESETIYGNTADGKIPVTSFADNLRRLYSSPRNPEIIFTVGDFVDSNNTNQKYGVILYRTTASSDIYELAPSYGYYWRVLMGPPLTSYYNYNTSVYSKKPWIVSDFEDIRDVALSKTRPEMVVVGKAKSNYNLVIFQNASTNDFRDYTVQKLNFEIIYTVCNLGDLWVVGGKPSQSDEWNGGVSGAVFNNKCVAYTFDLENWKYIDFTDGADVPYVTMPGKPFLHLSSGGTPTNVTDSINFEANDIKPIELYGQTGILLQISFNYHTTEFPIGLDTNSRVIPDSGTVGEKIYFMYVVSGEKLIIKQNSTYPEPSISFRDTDSSQNRKQLAPSFTTVIDNIERRFVASEYPSEFNMFYVVLQDNEFKLSVYISDKVPNSIAESGTKPDQKFRKFINTDENFLFKRTNGHCYKIEKVKNDNFITGVNSARYVSIGKGNFSNVLWSDDLLTWNDSNVNGIFDIVFDVTHKLGMWIAIGEGIYEVAISKDGKNWTGVYTSFSHNFPEITSLGTTFNSLDHHDPWQAASVATAEGEASLLANGSISSIYVTKGGSGYLSAPVVTVRDDVWRTVSGTALISNGSVTSINIPNYAWMNSNGMVSTDYTEYPPYVVTIAPPTITNNITDVLPYVPNLKGIFLRNLSLLRLFSRIEYHVGSQIWQTLTFDDIKAMLDTEFGAGEYAKLLKNCSTINKDGSTRLTTWIPGFTKTLNSKLETFVNVSENGSFPSGLLKDQKLSIKVYYNNLENVIKNELTSSDMNNDVFDNFMNNTLIPCDRDPNYFIDSFLADNYGFQLGDKYKNVNGKFKLKFSTDIQRLRLYCKQFELDDIEIDRFNKGVKQVPKITQSLYFDADNTANLLLDLDNFNLYASHIIVSGWLTSEICITDMNLELNGYSYNKTIEPIAIDFATKLCLGLNYNRYTFNGVDKEDGIGSLVIPLASTAYSGSSVPLDRYDNIRLRINFNKLAGPKSYINVTCVGTTTVSYINSTANIDLY